MWWTKSELRRGLLWLSREEMLVPWSRMAATEFVRRESRSRYVLMADYKELAGDFEVFVVCSGINEIKCLTQTLAHSIIVVLIKVLWLWWGNFFLHKMLMDLREETHVLLSDSPLWCLCTWSQTVPEATSQGGRSGVPRTRGDPHCCSQSGLEWVENSLTVSIPNRAPVMCWAVF